MTGSFLDGSLSSPAHAAVFGSAICRRVAAESYATGQLLVLDGGFTAQAQQLQRP